MFIDTKEFQGSSRAVEATFPRPVMEGTRGAGEPVHLTGRISRAEGAIRLQGRLRTSAALACARCDGTFHLPLEIDIDLLYTDAGVLAPAVEDMVLRDEDCVYVALDDQKRIDLDTLAREQIYLALPLKPICQPECRGLCGHCGADLNQEPCTCQAAEPDPRWGTLAILKNRL